MLKDSLLKELYPVMPVISLKAITLGTITSSLILSRTLADVVTVVQIRRRRAISTGARCS
jgi:hypothetical protein